jgi:SNF2 family DNA or RNA helicase
VSSTIVNGQRKSLEPWLFDTVEYYPHQVEGVRKLARMQNFLLADDMGLGKSLQALTVACIDIIRGWAEKIVIVAPVSLKGNWADEIEKFTTLPYTILGQEVLPGPHPGSPDRIKKLTPQERSLQLAAYALDSGPRVLVVNYEQVKPHLAELNGIGFDICIYDEAHYMKNYKSQRTKACLALEGNRHFLLTGTPMLNHVNELWPLLHKIDPDGYPKYWTFIRRYAVFGGYKNKQIIGVKNERELTDRLQSVMVRRMKKDVLDLPDVQIIQRKVDLTVEQRTIYDELFDELPYNMVDYDDEQKIDNALTKFLRLKQVCATTLPFNGKDISSKLDLVIEDALQVLEPTKEEFARKLVIFSQFRPVIEAVCNRIDEAAKWVDIWELHGDIKTHARSGVVKEWAAHQAPGVIVCNPIVAGVGLNMTAARHGFFVDKLFVPGLNQQAVDRMHRIGADLTQPIQITEYICRGTIENRVEQILRTKKKLFGSIVDESDFKRKLIQAMLEREDDAA